MDSEVVREREIWVVENRNVREIGELTAELWE